MPRYADDSDGDGQVDEDEPHVSRGFSEKTDLFLKYIEEMYLKGTFEKDEQVTNNLKKLISLRNILSGHSPNLAQFFGLIQCKPF